MICEKYLRRLEELADARDVGWNYAPLHTILKEGPPAKRTALPAVWEVRRSGS